jgi:2-polyprenyl-3-methyl-5-hydroxy-6-metoxy-1,4-benzoquinol methylase
MDLIEGENGVDPAQHWYYQAKAMLVERLLQPDLEKASTIVDVGAGSGFFSRFLLERHRLKTAFCVDVNYKNEHVETANAKTLNFVRKIDGLEADVILLMDVLEHVDDDAALLNEYVSQVGPNTTLLITVPAFQILWSAHDVTLGHYRRYTLKQISALAERCGLQISKARYFYGAIFPVALAVRVARRNVQGTKSDLKPVPGIINDLLRKICYAELLIGVHNRAFGLSAVLVARKKPNA